MKAKAIMSATEPVIAVLVDAVAANQDFGVDVAVAAKAAQ